MRDPNRIAPILAKLQQAWEESPDLRLGQLVENIVAKERNTRVLIASRGAGKTKAMKEILAHPIFSIEDDVFETALDIWLKYPDRDRYYQLT